MRQVVKVRKNNNIIEINGKRYDTRTGAALPHASSTSTGTPATAKPTAATKTAKQPAKPAAPRVSRSAAPHNVSREPAAATTLMRRAVRKPSASPKHRFRVSSPADALVEQPGQSIAFKNSARQLNEQRLKHAEQISKSRLVKRFVPVTAMASTGSAQIQPDTPAPQPSSPAATVPAAQTAVSAKRPKTTADLLERAVQQASSHQEPPLPKPPGSQVKRNVGIGATVTLAVVLLGLIVTQNLSSVRLQMASAKAGFNASLPGYQPSGYSLGQLQYASGVVSVQFHSNSDERHYTITQKPSSWDSSALRDNFVASTGSQYQTVANGGRTIYLYGANNATWVNGGVWYIVQSDGSLSDRQLVDLAASL